MTGRRLLAAAGVAALLAHPLCAQPAERWDLLITGGTVIDGTGAPRARADVAIRGTRIVAVSSTPLARANAARVIDATGLIVAPGFIDLHAHLEPLLLLPDAMSHVRQGVTLAIGFPDGGGPLGTWRAYVDSVSRTPLGMNVAYLVGHNAIRRDVLGTIARAPSAEELTRMRQMVATAMEAGAFGLSTGLRYVPGFYATTDEVVALAEEAAKQGGIYTSHLREEGRGIFEGVGEALEIGRRAKIPVILTHHKVIGQPVWGKSVSTLAMVDSARRAGTDVMIDQYPYTASSTSLSVLIPPWALAGGDSAFKRRLGDPVLLDSITKGVIEYLDTDRGGGDVRRVQFASVSWDRSLEGKTLADWADRRGVPRTSVATAPLVLEGQRRGGASMVFHAIDEGDVRRIMAHPMTMIASDGRLTRPGDGVPHPRAYGTFPRVLGEYVREQKLFSLETGVAKMTGMPAKRLGLTDRGCVRTGCVADLTIFDAARIRDAGTFTDPHHYADGIPWVLVNGVPVVANGEPTSARPGVLVRKAAAR
ncbi:MAG: D-aminoacylase [Gemmatimonadaceae bacterium]|nr:D-aminoacylase [Gemmatimonadaceae bacterium]